MDATSTDYRATPKRTILGPLDNRNAESPISPMANLKLLIKVATSHEDNPSDVVAYTSPKQVSKTKYTRQLRSLGFICKKFLQLYPLNLSNGECKQISLGHLAQELEIEKRRVYDIINVVSSLSMAVKVCKDRYLWYGNQHLLSLLCKLKLYAIKNKLDHLMETVQSLSQHNYCDPVSEKFLYDNALNAEHSSLEDNRIGILSQKFVMLFLVAPGGVALNLGIISRLILPKDIQDKTGMRRLYDIANVLESLGIIKRYNYSKSVRKPSFIYCGPLLPVDPNQLLETSTKSHIMPLRSPYMENMDSCDSNSSGDGQGYRLHDMLEVASTELKKISEKVEPTLRDQCSPSAKKRLFLSTETETPQLSATSFIRAPERSFRLLCNQITQKPEPLPAVKPMEDKPHFVPIQPANKIFQKKDGSFPTIKLNKIAHPITILKPVKLNAPDLQNGSIYKAVKSGDIIHLVKL